MYALISGSLLSHWSKLFSQNVKLLIIQYLHTCIKFAMLDHAVGVCELKDQSRDVKEWTMCGYRATKTSKQSLLEKYWQNPVVFASAVSRDISGQCCCTFWLKSSKDLFVLQYGSSIVG